MAWILAVDIGNTVTRLAAVSGAEVVALVRLPTGALDYPALVGQALVRLQYRLGGAPAAAGISTVVPGRDALVAAELAPSGVVPLAVGPEAAAGMAIAYDDPQALGPDRIANAVAARSRLGAPCVAVDLGTALTVDVVDAGGGLVGGALFPGVQAALGALAQATARIRLTGLGRPLSVIGQSTAAGAAAGLGYGYPALIDGLVARAREELAAPAPAILTGGGARYLATPPQTVQTKDPHLTLRGIAEIAARGAGLTGPSSGA